jgi:hypothetical protein
MAKQTVEITIDKSGNASLHVKGVQGNSCSVLTIEIEKALGETVTDTKTPEFFQKGVQNVHRIAG